MPDPTECAAPDQLLDLGVGQAVCQQLTPQDDQAAEVGGLGIHEPKIPGDDVTQTPVLLTCG
jgi:hypothetical protein